jgi:ABC-2 family transporter
MSAMTAPVHPEPDGGLRPLPWRRMGWVTWRQHRFALAAVALFLGGLAVYLWIVGRQVHHAYAAATACHPAASLACLSLIDRFNGMDKVLRDGYLFQAVPVLIGAFVGAPVLARELETGTFRFAWTQGFGRWRWTLAKLLALGMVAAAAAQAISILFDWYYRLYLAAGNHHLAFVEISPFSWGLFDLRGVAFAAWTLLAFAIGGLAGMLIRRVVPAIVATLVSYIGLALVVGVYLRQHYMTALVTNKLRVPASAWITSTWGTKNGTVAFTGRAPANLLFRFCPPSVMGPGKPSQGALNTCLTRHGYTLWTSYQPANRFWTFQLTEGGWLIALSMLLIAATVWLVRRRAA